MKLACRERESYTQSGFGFNEFEDEHIGLTPNGRAEHAGPNGELASMPVVAKLSDIAATKRGHDVIRKLGLLNEPRAAATIAA